MKKVLAFLLVFAVAAGSFGLAAFADGMEVYNPGLEVTTEPGKLKIKLEGEFNEKDWVGIYKNGETADPDKGGIVSLAWWYVGENGCEVELPTDSPDVFYNRTDEFLLDGNIIAGDYTVMVLADDGYGFKEHYGPCYVTVESTVMEGEDADKAPAAMLFFSDDSRWDLFSNMHDVSDFYYDDDKNCFVAEIPESLDPYIELCFGDLIELGELDYISADEAKVISIGVKFDPTAANELEFYYQTDEYMVFNEPKKVMADYSDTDGYQFVTIDLRQAPYWTGGVKNCRYDVFRSSKKDCEIEIYYVGLFKSLAGANEFGKAWLENGGGSNDPRSPEGPTAVPEGSTKDPEDPSASPAEPAATPGETAQEPDAGSPEPDDKTAAPETAERASESTKKQGGCGGLVSGMGVTAAAGISLLLRKKKKTNR